MFRSLFTSPLPTGIPAPDFTLPDQDGHPVRLAELRGRPVILIFYPADRTRVCTSQLCDWRDSWPGRACILGINPQSRESHSRFHSQQQLPFPLLVDRGQRVARMYRAHGLLVRRTVYAIDKYGFIRFAERGRPSPRLVLSAV